MTRPGGDHHRTRPGDVVVTSRDMYDQLVRLTDEVRDMGAPLKAAGATLTDHEVRIRGLERWRYALPVALVLTVASILCSIFLAVWGH